MRIKDTTYERMMPALALFNTYKSGDNVMEMAREYGTRAKEKNIKIVNVFIDRSAGRDIDRVEINHLLEELEKGKYRVLAVRSLDEITTNEEDLKYFLRILREIWVSVYVFEWEVLIIGDE